MRGFSLFLLAALLFSGCASTPDRQRYRDWSVYRGGPEGINYSALDQITRDNVSSLEVAWTYDTGDAFPTSELQCNPIVVDGLLIASTPKLRVIALDAATGELRWAFNPYEGEEVTGKKRNRGLMFWQDGADKRVYFAAGPWFHALAVATGKPVESFGDGGRVDLRKGLGRDPGGTTISVTTPGAVYKDLLIIGSILSEALPAGPGDIRALDARTGEVRWGFHAIPLPGEYGHDTWPADAWEYIGGANSWAGITLDEERGLVFAPTGSAAFDFYGSNRVGDNLFANSLLALNAETGERVWHFQFVKHDVWDRDLPSPAALIRVERDGRTIDAVAQITKSGFVFVFNRETGEPLFPIEEVQVRPSPVDGEVLAKTQVLPLAPPPFARQQLTEDLLTQRTPEARRVVLERFRKLRSGPQFTPPSHEGTIIFPGYDGGGEWGGPAWDPNTGLFYVNANEMAWILRIVEPPQTGRGGMRLYNRSCAMCHKADLTGSPPEFPALTGVSKRVSRGQILSVINEGRGRMPAYAHLGESAVNSIADYIITGADTTADVTETSSPIEQKYTHDGYNKFLDPDGYPAVAPPWGTLTCYDLSAGEIRWQIPFGEFPELAQQGMTNTGSENYGGGIVTAGGLLFIGATNHDKKFRAFDKLTGELLWETTLPASGNATPAVYEAGGRQFVVIAAGGGKSGATTGGSYVAFALPE
ncbi:MAG: PQQ-binding-like beta-propeller repeat protein [bacterium]|nr:PQQ-binding-like beta-propeller repeat protein [bacterium]